MKKLFLRKSYVFYLLLFFGLFQSTNSQGQCNPCPDGFTSTDLNPVYQEAFGSGANAFAGDGNLGLNLGANNDFAGTIIAADVLPTTDLTQACLSGNFEVVSDIDFTAFPMTFEFRIENVGAGGQRIDFNVPITGPGLISLDDLLSNGNNAGFNPAAPFVIVTAIANFSGTPTPDIITINYSDIAMSACVAPTEPEPFCGPCPDGSTLTNLNPVYQEAFGSGANAFAGDGNLGLNTGASNDFAGTIIAADVLTTTDLDQVCLSGNFDIVSDIDFAAFPMTFEFRVENVGAGGQRIDFNLPITGSGPISLGGLLSAGNNAGFNPAMPFVIVTAIANFSGTPTPDLITINYSDIAMTACVAPVDPEPGVSDYCQTPVTHFAGNLPSEILLTVTNVGNNTIEVSAESNTAAEIDFLQVEGPGFGAVNSTTAVDGVITLSIPFTAALSDFEFNMLWSQDDFGGNWQFIEGGFASTPFDGTCPVVVDPNASLFCAAPVTHFGGNPESEILLTVTNVGNNTIEVSAESNTAAVIDFLQVEGPGFGAVNSTTAIDGVITLSIPFTAAASDFEFQLLWSLDDFGGNWQFIEGGFASTPFEGTCPVVVDPNASLYCAAPVTHFGGNAESEILLTVTNVGNNTIEVSGESNTAAVIDFLQVEGPGFGAVNSTTATDGVITLSIPFTAAASDFEFQLLWSLDDFGGNWQFIDGGFASTPFEGTCPEGPVEPEVVCAVCPDENTFTNLNPVYSGAFNGGANSFAGEGFLGFNAGAFNDFAGVTIAHDALTTTDLTELCLAGNFDIVSDVDFSAFGLTLEFKIENLNTGNPANQINFNVPITGSGPISLGGLLADGNFSNFDPAAPSQIVIAIANFSGTAVPDLITINYSEISLSSCVAPVEPEPGCAPCPDGFTTTSLNPVFNEPFGSGGNAFAGDGNLGLNAGANNDFAGTTINVDLLPTTDLTQVCLTGNFDIVSDIDFAAFPMTLEFRIENLSNGGQRIDFNVPITGPGPISLGGFLATGTNAGFDPASPSQVVTAIANFSGTPTPDIITINYSDIALTACTPPAEPEPLCGPCPDGFTTTNLNPVFMEAFGSGANAFAGDGNLGLNAGSFNDFAGTIISADVLPTTDLDQVCLTGSFDIVSDIDFAAFPMTLEFRIENVGFGGQRIDFNVPITGPGPISLGGLLSSGTNAGFDANSPVQIVTAIANFSGANSPEIITINYSDIAFTACVDPNMNNSGESNYCETPATHFAGNAESEILLTVVNVGNNTIEVSAESNTFAEIDFLQVEGPGFGAVNSTTPVDGVITLSIPFTSALSDFQFNLLWSQADFDGNWLLVEGGTASTPFEGTCPVEAVSNYCETPVTHFAGNADSEISLTIENIDGTTIQVSASSNTDQEIDFFEVQGPNFATAVSTEVIDGVITVSIPFSSALTDFEFNLLWSQVGFDGNWLFLESGFESTPFTGICPVVEEPAVSNYCATPVTHFGGNADSEISLTVVNIGGGVIEISASSNTDQEIDFLEVQGPGFITVATNTVVDGVITVNVPFLLQTEDFEFQLLWSQVGFDGNWQLIEGGLASTPFEGTCPEDPVDPEPACGACPDGFSSLDLNPTFDVPFGSGENAFAGDGFLGLNPGANNDFAGSIIAVDLLQTNDLGQICLTGNFDIVSDVDFSTFGLTLEFKIENLNTGNPANQINFNVPITGPGPISLGGLLSTGLNESFNPTAPSQIVIAVANFSGTPAPGLITINYSDIALTACVPPIACTITSISAVGEPSECDPESNTYSQTVSIEYTDAPAGLLQVNGEFYVALGSPTEVTLTGLPSNAQGVDVVASFVNEPLCNFQAFDLFTAPSACFDFPVNECGAVEFSALDFETQQFNSDGLFGFGGDFNGQNWGIESSNGNPDNHVLLSSTAGNPYFYVGIVQQVYVPGGLINHPDAELVGDFLFNQSGNFVIKLESMGANYAGVTGATEINTPTTGVGTYDTYGFNIADNGGNIDLTSEYYQIVILATDGGFGNDDYFEMLIDNVSLGVPFALNSFDIGRNGALCAEYPEADENTAYTWYNESGDVVATFVGNPCYSPSELGTYTVGVFNPECSDIQILSSPRTITSLDGCCELEDE